MNLYESKLLLVDDEPTLLEMTKDLLNRAGFRFVDTAACYSEAVSKANITKYQLFVLDVMLPDGDGFMLYRQIKDITDDTPAIFLSARDEDYSRLQGLNLGADDYITKPFIPEELLLRIKAVLRRTYRLSPEGDVLILGDTIVSFASGEISKGGNTQTLTAKEYVILLKLFENLGRILTIESLCEAVWPEGNFGLESSLIVHIRHLREKIEEDPSNPKHLLTARGLGYKLVK